MTPADRPALFARYLSDYLDALQGDKVLTDLDQGPQALAASILAVRHARADEPPEELALLLSSVARLCGDPSDGDGMQARLEAWGDGQAALLLELERWRPGSAWWEGHDGKELRAWIATRRAKLGGSAT